MAAVDRPQKLSPRAKTILVIEDDDSSREIFRIALERAGYAVLVASSGAAGLDDAVSKKPDLIVSDVQMPDGDGVALCEELRRRPLTAGIPIILMSGLSRAEHHQLDGLERGADDYLLKPFSSRYLLTKVEAVLRRYAVPDTLKPILEKHGLSLDVGARTATTQGGRVVRLTRREFDLLTAFLGRPGRILTQKFLLDSVWGDELEAADADHAFTALLDSLRSKLEPRIAALLVSVAGRGYRFDAAPRP